MTKPYFLGLSGYAGSGKDTAANFLKEALISHGKQVDAIAFADPIRWMLMSLGVPQQYIINRDLKEVAIPGFNGCSARQMMQTLGTEWGRLCLGRNFWTSQVERRLAAWADLNKAPDIIIITDVRMANEANWINDQGGMVVRIERPGLKAVRPHESEQQVFGVADTIHNDKDLIHLRERCNLLSSVVLAQRALRSAA